MRKQFLSALAIGAAISTSYGQSLPGKVTVFTTAEKTGQRITQTQTLSFSPMPQPLETQTCVFVNDAQKYQAMTGIGGAITDASAETFYKLPKNKQAELLKAYYDPKDGIGYTLARTSINSTDFSSDTYTYVKDGDGQLASFNVAHDEKFKIPLIKEAMKAAGGNLLLYASPWSPPAWMKDNNSMLQGGKLLAKYYQSWANYYVKFIQAYESRNIPVWGLTVQNEPMAKQRWESCIYTAEEERDFIKNHLGPTLAKANMGGKKLIAWDHNRDLIFQRAGVLLSDPGAAKYIWGIGFHWYETWTGSAMQFGNVRNVHESFPDKALIFTEGCKEKFNYGQLSDWSLGERYGHSLINDFNAGTSGWTDWNILLDETGGPNHVGNFCFAPVHANLKEGNLVYTNAYYYLGHFSKFIRPGAKRIAAVPSTTFLESTAFVDADGKIAVVVMNSTDKKIPYFLWLKGQAAKVESEPHSISTLIIE